MGANVTPAQFPDSESHPASHSTLKIQTGKGSSGRGSLRFPIWERGWACTVLYSLSSYR